MGEGWKLVNGTRCASRNPVLWHEVFRGFTCCDKRYRAMEERRGLLFFLFYLMSKLYLSDQQVIRIGKYIKCHDFFVSLFDSSHIYELIIQVTAIISSHPVSFTYFWTLLVFLLFYPKRPYICLTGMFLLPINSGNFTGSHLHILIKTLQMLILTIETFAIFRVVYFVPCSSRIKWCSVGFHPYPIVEPDTLPVDTNRDHYSFH